MKQLTTHSVLKRTCNTHFAGIIGTVVKKLREAAHLSAKECQLETGINFSMVECGKRKLSTQSICRLCVFFGITIKQFFSEVQDQMGCECSFFPGRVPTNPNVIKYKEAIEKLFIKPKFHNN